MRKYRKTILLILLFMISCTMSQTLTMAAEPFEMHLLDVGQGQSVLIEADGRYMLIDGGGRDSSSFVVSYLRQQGIETLDYVIVSHYDEDHMAGIIGVLSVFEVGTFLTPDYSGEGELYQSLAAAALSNGCMIMHAIAGEEFRVGNAAVIIVGPVGDYSSDNDRSLAVKVHYGNKAFLICGDAEQPSELDMAGSGTDLRADVYVVDHHGSSTSSMDVFLDAISPSYALVSCGADNSYGHPALETMQRLQNHGITMFRTDLQGTIVAATDGTEIWFNTSPCDDWTCGNGILGLGQPVDGDGSETGSDEEGLTRQMPENGEQQADQTYTYVCNTNSKKFHYPHCSSVEQMKEENRLYTDLSREDLIAQGYEPCGNCKP